VGFSAAYALWGVEALLFFLLVRLIRDRRRLEELHDSVVEGTLAAGSNGGLSSHQRRMREQWPLMASDMRREGKSPAEIELVRKQVFSSN
jgi:HAMP domain-containing protein